MINDDNVHKTITELSELEKGWDGYSAKSIPFNIFEIAHETLDLVNDVPQVFPTCRETIQFEFDKENKSLELEIFEDKMEILISYDNSEIFLENLSIEESIVVVNNFNVTWKNRIRRAAL